MRTTVRTARQLHLARAARTAGEAFAFIDQEAEGTGRRALPVGGIALSMLGLLAAAALFVGL
jgi:hypothetical protein